VPGRKGNQAEREVARALEAWWRRLVPDARFERTPQSGGLQHAVEFRVVGDVMVGPTAVATFPWSVEVKRREAGNLTRLVAGKPTAIWGWWREAQDDAHSAGLEPMLWFRRNRRRWRVLVRRSLADVVADAEAADGGVRAWGPGDVPPGGGVPPVLYLAADLVATDPARWARMVPPGR
jgi:hypothetical protein